MGYVGGGWAIVGLHRRERGSTDGWWYVIWVLSLHREVVVDGFGCFLLHSEVEVVGGLVVVDAHLGGRRTFWVGRKAVPVGSWPFWVVVRVWCWLLGTNHLSQVVDEQFVGDRSSEAPSKELVWREKTK